jgi:tRNA dimethylallyltransferase
MSKIPQIIVVVGPTASGKSDFAVELALTYNGEIISADSRQIYKGLDIGTGKITPEEMKGIKHHMLDVCELGEDFSVAEYKRHAMPILEDIISRGKTPIICGGTGQYIDALIFDQEIPQIKPNKKLREELEKKTADELYTELTAKDIRRATMIDKHNKVRLIRALEIIEAVGLVPEQPIKKYLHSTQIYLLDISRELLRERITKRLVKRLENGMKEEVEIVVKKLQSQCDQNLSSMLRKLGREYVTISKYLEGKITEEEMEEEVITKSMQYAKRQQTWNKKYIPVAEIITIKE